MTADSAIVCGSEPRSRRTRSKSEQELEVRAARRVDDHLHLVDDDRPDPRRGCAARRARSAAHFS